jgi:hypothetical protein
VLGKLQILRTHLHIHVPPALHRLWRANDTPLARCAPPAAAKLQLQANAVGTCCLLGNGQLNMQDEH